MCWLCWEVKQKVLTKLAIRNVKRSISDYILYVITVTFILALMFSFNSMMFSDLILGMNSHMVEYRSLLVLFSIIVLVVVAWLINYMTRFMLEKRSKEFGTYLILGMKNKDVSKLFFYENIFLGIIALVLGIIFGNLVFQGLLIVVTSFFGEEYHLKATFNIFAILLTIVYYTLIQIIVVVRNNRYLKKLKISELINAAKVNELVKVKHVTRNAVIFMLSIVAGIIAITKAPILVVIICLIFFIYGFYMGLSGILVLLIGKTKRFKFKKMNLFIFRQLASKINTMGFTMGTIAVLFTLALLSSNYAIGLSNFKGEIEKYGPFDICLTSCTENEEFTEVKEMLANDGWIKDDLTYKIYKGENDQFKQELVNNDISGGYFQFDTFIKLSDYNVLRGFLGLDSITLAEDQYAVHAVASVSSVYKDYMKETPITTINGKDFTCAGVYDVDFAQNGQNGAGYVVIVPDDVVKGMPIYYSQYVCDTTKKTDNDLYKAIQKFVPQDAEDWTSSGTEEIELDHGMGVDSVYMIYDNIMVKNAGLIADIEAAIITIVVSIVYVALVFICVALTILAVQQLSDSTKYRFRYKVLNHLGVNKEQRAKLVLKQLLIYFGCPVIIPVAVSMVISYKLNQILLTGTQIQSGNISFFLGAVALFLVVYVIYFVATYIGFKHNIEQDL